MGVRTCITVVRIAIGTVLCAFFALGSAVLWVGLVLHFQFTDASDPPIWAVERSFWLAYLSVLDVFWGASAASILWPGQRRVSIKRVLNVGATLVGLSGGALLAGAYMHDAGRLYGELAGLILLSAIAAGIFLAWPSRQASCRNSSPEKVYAA